MSGIPTRRNPNGAKVDSSVVGDGVGVRVGRHGAEEKIRNCQSIKGSVYGCMRMWMGEMLEGLVSSD